MARTFTRKKDGDDRNKFGIPVGATGSKKETGKPGIVTKIKGKIKSSKREDERNYFR